MEQTTKDLPGLINAVTSELSRLRYSPVTISKCNAVWQKLLSYTQAKDLLHFSEKLCESFLLEYYKYPAEYSDKFPYGTRIAVRAVRMLGDYQLHGVILRKRKKQQPPCPHGFTDAIRGFVLYSYQCRNTVKTVERKIFIVNCFIEYLTTQNIAKCSEITNQHVSGFITTILGFKKRTINQYLYKLGCFFCFLHLEGYSSINLRMAIPKINDAKERRIPTVWSPDEIDRLLLSVDRGNPRGKRDYAILLMVAQLGLRDSDVCNLMLENLNWQANRLEFNQIKTLQPVSLPLLQKVGWAIIDYLKKGRPITESQNLFIRHNPPYDRLVSVYSILQRHLALAGIKTSPDRPHGLHVLRHTLASRLLEQHTPVEIISQVLGHASISSTKDYLHVDIDSLRRCALDPDGGVYL